jgi:hypothetical protein
VQIWNCFGFFQTTDLFGLVQFLGIDPYCDLRWWQDLVYGPYCQGNCAPLNDLMANIMWRTAKKDVLHQVHIWYSTSYALVAGRNVYRPAHEVFVTLV